MSVPSLIVHVSIFQEAHAPGNQECLAAALVERVSSARPSKSGLTVAELTTHVSADEVFRWDNGPLHGADAKLHTAATIFIQLSEVFRVKSALAIGGNNA